MPETVQSILATRRNASGPRALLVNPMVYDTQYWPEWGLPSGLLKIGHFLTSRGYQTRLIDCLFPDSKRRVKKSIRSVVQLGSAVEEQRQSIPKGTLGPERKYKFVFGSTVEAFTRDLQELAASQLSFWDTGSEPFVPDEVYVTSVMTYWWESTVDVVCAVKHVFPKAHIRVGGIYPTLAPAHLQAKLHSIGLHFKVMYGAEFEKILGDVVDDLIVVGEVPSASWSDLDYSLYLDPRYFRAPARPGTSGIPPAEDPQCYVPTYSILTTTRGCPFDCAYCAQRAYNLGRTQVQCRPTAEVLRELRDKVDNFGVREFAFYEDNFLFVPGHLPEILRGIHADPVLKASPQARLHLAAPEGVEVRLAQSQLETLRLMKDAGFDRIYLPLENVHTKVTAEKWNRKHSSVRHFDQAVANCVDAGFSIGDMEINAFVLFGTPEEDIQSVIDTALYAANKLVPLYQCCSPPFQVVACTMTGNRISTRWGSICSI